MKDREEVNGMVLELNEYSKVMKESEIILTDSLWVSDIFFKKQSRNAKRFKTIEPGTYISYLQYYENKIAWLYLCHSDYLNLKPDTIQEEMFECHSGFFGVFSEESFKRKDETNDWYDQMWSQIKECKKNPYFKDLHDLLNEQEEEKNRHLKVIKKHKLEENYYKSIISQRIITIQKPAFLDGESIVPASGNGEGDYTFKVGYHDDKITSLEFNFMK